MTNAIDNARKILNYYDKDFWPIESRSEGVLIDVLRDLLDSLEYEYRVVDPFGEQSGPITTLEDAESGRWSSGFDGDIVEGRIARGKWEKVS